MAIAGFQLTGFAALLVWCSRVLGGRRVGWVNFPGKPESLVFRWLVSLCSRCGDCVLVLGELPVG
ncbi:hypothetical protein, partial [Mycobacterium marinum]|uniref:hypothetical protein n=1 Tax=Mycobacterium marinum TaxID=1781 RepID=UPI001AA07336